MNEEWKAVAYRPKKSEYNETWPDFSAVVLWISYYLLQFQLTLILNNIELFSTLLTIKFQLILCYSQMIYLLNHTAVFSMCSPTNLSCIQKFDYSLLFLQLLVSAKTKTKFLIQNTAWETVYTEIMTQKCKILSMSQSVHHV